MMHTFTFTPPQIHELVTALHRNRAKIQQRIRHNERLAATPEEQERRALDPGRKVYMEAMTTCRQCRIETIDALLELLEKNEQ